MDINIEILGLIAGMITSIGFFPQLIRGYRTKKLEDLSYFMPMVLALGMALWFVYGYITNSIAVMIANAFSICCSLALIIMKKKYS